MERSREGERPTVLVTGASGLLGKHICGDLARDHDVVGLDRDPPEDVDLWLECDLTDAANVTHALERLRAERGPRLASVVHLAAYYDFSGEPSPLYDDLTVAGTRRLLRALQRMDVGQFVFSSSLLVMRAVEPGEVLDERSPVAAEWEYPRSKLDAERVMRVERGGIPIVVLRIAGVYDEGCHSIPIAQQIRRIYERKLESHFFPGEPDHGQSFVHLEDVVRCVRLTVERRSRLGGEELFLVGEEDVVSYGDMQDRLGEALYGTSWPTLRIPAPLAKVGAWVKDKTPGLDPFIKPWMIDLADAHLPITTRHARERLGWSAGHRLWHTLPRMVDDLLADPSAWYEENGLEQPARIGRIERRRERRARERQATHG